MRLVQFRIPEGTRESLLSVLDDESVDYALLTGEDATYVQCPLPAQAVEPILDELDDAGLDDRYVVVSDAVSARSEHFDELEERYVTGTEADESVEPGEIRAGALDLTPKRATYYAMTVLSAIVAVSGLLLDSPELVVGSMVIAPQVGSALTAGVGIVVDDPEMVRSGIVSQVLGLLVAVAAAAVLGWLLRSAAFVPVVLDVTTVNQISQLISPGALSVVVALAAGAAGAIGLATALPVSLAGVAVAATLVPAAAAVGIGIAWGLPTVASGAALMLLTNVVAIDLAVPATLWAYGYRPVDWGEVPWRRYARVATAVLILLAAFVGTVSVTGTQMAFERDANRAATDTLQDPAYGGLTLQSVRATVPLVDGGSRVTVTVARPADRPYPKLPGRLRTSIERRTGRSMPVEVRFVEQGRAGG